MSIPIDAIVFSQNRLFLLILCSPPHVAFLAYKSPLTTLGISQVLSFLHHCSAFLFPDTCAVTSSHRGILGFHQGLASVILILFLAIAAFHLDSLVSVISALSLVFPLLHSSPRSPLPLCGLKSLTFPPEVSTFSSRERACPISLTLFFSPRSFPLCCYWFV